MVGSLEGRRNISRKEILVKPKIAVLVRNEAELI